MGSTGRAFAAVGAGALLLLCTACTGSTDLGTGTLDQAQCEALREQEGLLMSAVGDDWRAAMENPVTALIEVQDVVREVQEIAADHAEEQTISTFTSITDAFLAYQLRVDAYVDTPPVPGDPVESGRHAQLRDNLTWALDRGCG